ncbi:MAG: hypothetical protein AAB448_03075 [Patescibacteria group bacterium]
MNLKDSERAIKEGIMGYRNYKSEKNKFFEEDFEDAKNIGIFLEEVSNGESDLTNFGKAFLLKKLQETDIAQKVLDARKGPYDASSTRELVSLVEKMSPHETASFMKGAKEKAEERRASEK